MDLGKNLPLLIPDQCIQEQLQKILRYPDFAVSGVMSRFLTYIINETISHRSDEIKEYTIGVEVLKKPALYKTGLSGVVRVHAGRVRNALDKYYKTQGAADEVLISMPKGRYIPCFEYHKQRKKEIIPDAGYYMQDITRMAVFPLTVYGKDDRINVLSDHIVLILSAELAQRKNITVLANYSTARLIAKDLSLKKIARDYRLKYIVTGSIHFEDGKFCLYVELSDVKNENQAWAHAYILKHEKESISALADKIVFQILSDLKLFAGIFGTVKADARILQAGKRMNEKKIYYLNPYEISQYKSSKKISRATIAK